MEYGTSLRLEYFMVVHAISIPKEILSYYCTRVSTLVHITYTYNNRPICSGWSNACPPFHEAALSTVGEFQNQSQLQ